MPLEISYPEFNKILADVIANRKPFSFVRCGDGEGIVIGFPQYTPCPLMHSRLSKWFDDGNISVQDMKSIAEQVRQAVKDADVLGLPGKRHEKGHSKYWANVKPYIKNLALAKPETKTVCMDVVFEFAKQKAFHQLLKGLPELYCISCRNLSEQMSKAFGIPKVHTFILPPQNNPRVGACLTDQRHYPTLFNQVPKWLDDQPAKGNVFLVGAGGLGKVYCNWIKQRGGVAIDMGSILDGWSGLVTRSYLKEMDIKL